jgi:ribosome-associated protein
LGNGTREPTITTLKKATRPQAAKKAPAKSKPAIKKAAKPAKAPRAKKPRAKSGTKTLKSRPSAALLALALRSLDDDKAVDVATIDLVGKTSIADHMVVASGRSQRQVGAMAVHLMQRMKAAGYRGVSIEGMPQNDWVLVDAGDVIVHLFRPEVRTFYNLEKMWSADFTEAAAKSERATG